MRRLPRRRFRPANGAAGFTLLEITAAMLIFFLVVMFSLWMMSDATDQSLGAWNARSLRMLAERRLGEIAVFEKHYDEPDGGGFDDLPEELREEYAEWEWETEIRDVTVFGTQKDENAPYLFGDPGDDEKESSGTGAGDAGATKKGDTQVLREIVLRIRAPGAEGETELIEVVTYLPQVAQKAAAK